MTNSDIIKSSVIYCNFFHREYIFRHICDSDNYESLKKCMDILISFLRRLLTSPINDDFLIFICDKLLEFHYISREFYDTATKSLDFSYARFFNGLYDELKDYDFIDGLHGALMKKTSTNKAFTELFNASLKYGVYATHISTFRDKDYPVAKFDSSYIKDITEPEFFTLRDEDKYVKSLSPKEFSLLFDSASEHNFFSEPQYVFFLDIQDSTFNIINAMDIIRFRAFSYLINHKLENGIDISDEEFAEYKKNNIVIFNSSMDQSGVFGRLTGIKMWDLVFFEGMTQAKAYYKLAEDFELYGLMSYCKGKNAPISCDTCEKESTRKCFIYCSQLYSTARQSIHEGRIASTNARHHRKAKGL